MHLTGEEPVNITECSFCRKHKSGNQICKIAQRKCLLCDKQTQ